MSLSLVWQFYLNSLAWRFIAWNIFQTSLDLSQTCHWHVLRSFLSWALNTELSYKVLVDLQIWFMPLFGRFVPRMLCYKALIEKGKILAFSKNYVFYLRMTTCFSHKKYEIFQKKINLLQTHTFYDLKYNLIF